MKNILTFFFFSALIAQIQAQTVEYDVPVTDFSANDCAGTGCVCGTDPSGITYVAADLTFSWTSSVAVAPTSVTVELYSLYFDVTGAPVELNSVGSGSYTSSNFTCAAVTEAISVNPASYNPAGSNTFKLDYATVSGTIELTENTGWGTTIYARVTVVYPVAPAPPVANTDYATCAGGSTGNIIDVQANDTDPNGDPLTTTLLMPPTSGGNATVLNGDSVSYDPPAGFCGQDTITYQVCDPTPFCDKDTIFVTVTDGAVPDMVCQNIDVYLDSSGIATITPADVDGGTTDNCSPFNLTLDISSFNCGDIVAPSANNLAITAVYDGPLTGGFPKGVELYVVNAIADLSEYGLGSANNGGGTDGEEFTFPAVAATAGQFIYVSSDSTGFRDFFGFNADYVASAANINGDDAIELFHTGAVIDLFGDINTDGTGEPWEYLDGWAYSYDTRVLGVTFDHTDWRFSGTNALDGESSNIFAAVPVPIGTYSPSLGGTSVTLTATDTASNTAFCVAAVTVYDTISPYFMNCPGNVVVATTDSGCTAVVMWTAPSEMDNCATGLSVSSSHSSGDVFPQGITVVTYTATDFSGNAASCTFNVEVTSGLDASVVTTDVSCNGDSSGTAVLTVTGNIGSAVVDWGAMNDSTLPAGTHTYSVVDSIGCMVLDSVTIDQPDSIMLSSVVTDEIASGSNGEIDLSVSGGNGGYTFDWDNDGTGDNDDTEDLSGLSSGTYNVTVIDSLGCSDSLSVFVDNASGVIERGEELKANLFPNPSDGTFIIEMNNYTKSTIEILDVIGNKILVIQNPTKVNSIDITAEPAGVYLVKIASNDMTLTRRIIVRK